MKLVSINKLLLGLSIILSLPGYAQEWSLSQCIDTAKVYNKTLQIKQNAVAIGHEKQKEARANLMPKITANADYKYFTDLPYQMMPASIFGGEEGQYKEAQFGVPHNINANLQAVLPLYNPQIFGAMETAKIGTEINELQFRKTEEQIFLEISHLYYNAQILQKKIDFLDGNIINTQKLLKTLQLLKEQLMAKGTDVAKVELQLQQLTTQRNLANSQLRQVLNVLRVSMGIPIDQPLLIKKEISKQEALDYGERPSLDFLLASKQRDLAGSELETLKMSRLPTVSLFGSYGTTGFGYDKSPNDFLKFYPVAFAGVQVSVPLFNGTVTQRKISTKNLEMTNHALQIDLVKEQNAMHIANTRMERQNTLHEISTTAQQIKLAESVYDQTVLQHKEGTASVADILLADNALREAHQSYLSSLVDFLKADLDLKKLTGNFLSNDNKN